MVIFKTHDMFHQKWRRPGYFLQMFVSLAQINWGWSWQREINQSGRVKQDLISHLTWCTKCQEQHVMLFEAAKDVLFQSYRSEPFSTYSAASMSAWQVKTLHNVQSCFLVAAEKNLFPSNACAGELNIYMSTSPQHDSLCSALLVIDLKEESDHRRCSCKSLLRMQRGFVILVVFSHTDLSLQCVFTSKLKRIVGLKLSPRFV